MVSFTNHSYPAELAAQVDAALAGIERVIGARLGDPDNPLLVSVRSGGARLDAGNDGYCAKSRAQRRERRRPRAHQPRRALRL